MAIQLAKADSVVVMIKSGAGRDETLHKGFISSATKHFFSSAAWTSQNDSITFGAVVGGSNCHRLNVDYESLFNEADQRCRLYRYGADPHGGSGRGRISHSAADPSHIADSASPISRRRCRGSDYRRRNRGHRRERGGRGGELLLQRLRR